ncbi:hypothetical protein E1H13_06020 [Nodosilinea sp. P-1105]|nr:hypothetical protein [Nodosilinea sp. P-1105]
MAKPTGLAAVLGTMAFLSGVLIASTYHQPPVNNLSAVAADSGRRTSYRSQASRMLNGVVAPLNSLKTMKRAIAVSPTTNVREVATLAILTEPLKTTGLGPIEIGMSLGQIRTKGLRLEPMANSGSGECKYYKLQNHSDPIGLMAIDNRVLRIDVWPGSETETLSGAKIGSTEEELVQLYGDQLEATANPITLGKTIVFTPKDPGEDIFRLVFETDDRGRVVQYRAGQFPSVTWPEGCL